MGRRIRVVDLTFRVPIYEVVTMKSQVRVNRKLRAIAGTAIVTCVNGINIDAVQTTRHSTMEVALPTIAFILCASEVSKFKVLSRERLVIGD